MSSHRLPPVISFDAATFMEHASMMSREHILTRLAEKTLILHSTPPQGRHHNNGRSGYKKLQNNLYHYSNPALLPKVYRSAWMENLLSRFRSIHRRVLLSNLSASNSPPILYLWHPEFSKEIGRYDEALIVYHIYDDYPNLPGATPDIAEREIEILQKADIVFCANKSLIAARKKIVNRDYIHIPQGVDFTAFSKRNENSKEPEDIGIIKHPRIGYLGRINKKVNINLIEELTRKNKNWNFVFIGPLDKEISNSTAIENMKTMKNAYFLGPKDYKDIPDYWHSIDIAVIPYNHEPGQWAFYGSPLKLQEAFAAGKSVVICPLNEAQAYGELIKIAETEEQWIDAIEDSLEEKNDVKKIKKRIDFASKNSWDSRVSVIEKTILHRLAKNKTEQKAMRA